MFEDALELDCTRQPKQNLVRDTCVNWKHQNALSGYHHNINSSKCTTIISSGGGQAPKYSCELHGRRIPARAGTFTENKERFEITKTTKVLGVSQVHAKVVVAVPVSFDAAAVSLSDISMFSLKA